MSFLEVFGVALRLGLTSFGGPAAHVGYYRAEYVRRRGWLTDEELAELLAVAQFLPGPSSSQVGAAIGHHRAGWPGALAAWLGFTAPSALAMAAFAAVSARVDVSGTVWLHALKLVAVAVVTDAVLALAFALTRTVPTVAIAAAVAAVALLLPPGGPVQLLLLAGAGLLTLAARRLLAPAVPPEATEPPAATESPDAPAPADQPSGPRARVSRRTGAALLATFGVLFATVLVARPFLDAHPPAALAAAMYRSGSLVFGGGHVVLPLLQAETVPRLVPAQEFLAGYGAAQAVPGPLFSFGAFLGQASAGVTGALVATVAIFLPGMLLMFGVLPFWQALRRRPAVRAAMVGVNAAVVGLLAAALVSPIGTSAVRGLPDLAYAAVLLALLRLARWRPLLVVAVALAASPLLGLT